MAWKVINCDLGTSFRLGLIVSATLVIVLVFVVADLPRMMRLDTAAGSQVLSDEINYHNRLYCTNDNLQSRQNVTNLVCVNYFT